MKPSNQHRTTRELLIKHYQTYPKLQISDIFKFLYQSSFGCEHLITERSSVIERIKQEYSSLDCSNSAYTDKLDGEYSRVHLSCLKDGLAPETLGKLFVFSAKAESDTCDMLLKRLTSARELISEGELPLSAEEFDNELELWRKSGFPALHHSDIFRSEYRPAYRVIADRYVKLLPLLTQIDKRLSQGSLILAIEGGSASGKTTLARFLEELYGCSVFHMDDFFLRPEQRTPERYAETGGNVDRERFLQEVLTPLSANKTVRFSPFDCSTQALGQKITVIPKKLTVVEGAYSMHPELASYYGLSVFLDIDARHQKKRILKRNSPEFAKRFFKEWIPLELRYFSNMSISSRCDITITVEDTDDDSPIL